MKDPRYQKVTIYLEKEALETIRKAYPTRGGYSAFIRAVVSRAAQNLRKFEDAQY